MSEQIKKYPHEVTLICVGSLTNAALMIMQDPSIVPLIKEIIIMGGAIHVPGNHKMHAEANIYADPESADLVFRSGANITLVGLDVTMKVILDPSEVDQWKYIKTPKANFLYDITSFYIDAYQRFYKEDIGCTLHDPLAVAVAIDSTFVKKKPMLVHVDLEGLHSYGRTVADLRERAKEGPNLNVCVDVDVDHFLKHFLHTAVY